MEPAMVSTGATVAPAAAPNVHNGEAVSDPALGRPADRAVAALLDAILTAAPFAVIGMWAATRWGGVTSNGFNVQGLAAVITIGAVVVLWFLYFWLFEAVLGATIGKFMMNLRVRRLDGTSVGLGRSLVRTLARFVDGLAVYLVGFIVMLVSRRRQRVGNHLAGTIVVERPSHVAARVSASVLWASGVVACLLGAYMLHPAPGGAGVLTDTAARSASDAGGQIVSAALGTDRTDDFQIINPRADFPPETPKILCVWKVAGVAADVPVTSVWIADNVGDAAPAGLKIAKRALRGYPQGSFSLTSPANGWPVGRYHVEIYIGDRLARRLPFSVTPR